MSIRKLGTYDDLGVWFAHGFVDLGTPEDDHNLPDGLSIAVVLGESDGTSRERLERAADTIASLSPTLVHCFGPMAETVHDAIDRELIKRAVCGTLTYWNGERQPAQVVFEMFRTDLPPEAEFDRWSGRLIVVDEQLTDQECHALTEALRDVDATIRSLLDTEPA
jgi:hypothetical protein